MPKGIGTYGNTKGRPPTKVSPNNASNLKNELTKRETTKQSITPNVKNAYV